MDARQTLLDFGRAEQRGMLRDAALPECRSRDGKRVSPAHLAAALRVIDDHAAGRGECWLSYETIAAEMRVSVRTAKRSIECLESCSLICVETRRARGSNVVCNHYRIVWSELALRRQYRGEPDSPAPVSASAPSSRCSRGTSFARAESEDPARKRSAMPTDRSALGAERSALGTDRSAPGGTQSVLKRIEAPPPPTSSAVAEPLDLQLAAAAGMWISRIATVRAFLQERLAAGASIDQTLAELDRCWAIAEHRVNRGKLVSVAGAVLFRIRTGAWPAREPIMEDLERLAEVTARTAAASVERSVAQQDYDAMAIVRAGRKAGAPDDRIQAALEARGLGAASERLGWRDPPAAPKTSA